MKDEYFDAHNIEVRCGPHGGFGHRQRHQLHWCSKAYEPMQGGKIKLKGSRA